jgi:hypothetical protein
MPEGVELDYNLIRRIYFDCKMRTGVMERRWNNIDALHSSLSDLWEVIFGEEVPDGGQSRPLVQTISSSTRTTTARDVDVGGRGYQESVPSECYDNGRDYG